MKTLMNVTLTLVFALTSFAASAAELSFLADRPLLGGDDTTTESAVAAPCDSDEDGGWEAKAATDHEEGMPLDEFLGWEDEGRP